MKSGIVAGFIAGFTVGIVNVISDSSGFWELFSVHYTTIPVGIQHTLLYEIIFSSLWGIVFGGLYAFFYDYIPFTGVKKGLIFGLIIWVAVAVHPASLILGYGFHQLFVPMTFISLISTCLVYGSLIGILYKKE